MQGVGKEFVAGGVEQISESAMSLMVDGVYQIAEVMRGEKTLEEAGKGVAKNGARTFVLGGEGLQNIYWRNHPIKQCRNLSILQHLE